jgi:Leucine Rich Repeat
MAASAYTVCRLQSLKALSLMGCVGIEAVVQLRSLDVSWCSELVMLPSLGGLTVLEVLDLSHCELLEALPDDISALKHVCCIELSGCTKLRARSKPYKK